MLRDHSEILTSGDGPAAFARAIGEDPNKVYQWRRNNSIPADYWVTIAAAGLSTLTELAEAAARRRDRQTA